MQRLLLFCSLAVSAAGCGDRDVPISKGQIPLGEPLVSPELRVVAPEAGSTHAKSQPIRCVVEMVLAPKVTPPENVLVDFQRWDPGLKMNAGSSSGFLTLKSDTLAKADSGPHTATFEGDVPAPGTPGSYEVHAQAVLMQVTPPKSSKEPPTWKNAIAKAVQKGVRVQ
jgi:hypothetical protein